MIIGRCMYGMVLATPLIKHWLPLQTHSHLTAWFIRPIIRKSWFLDGSVLGSSRPEPEPDRLRTRTGGSVHGSGILLNQTSSPVQGSAETAQEPNRTELCHHYSCPFGYVLATSTSWHSLPYSNLVEHLICIGDPQQLRPNVSTFGEPPTF